VQPACGFPRVGTACSIPAEPGLSRDVGFSLSLGVAVETCPCVIQRTQSSVKRDAGRRRRGLEPNHFHPRKFGLSSGPFNQRGLAMRFLISVAIIAATFAMSGCFHHHQTATTEMLPAPPLK